ncbi:hypothetical protein RvY_07215 [Ramazzottius varieornatus]|uniref:RNA exonuclease 4 n=1 Tax=Ramazzottius varieornatus TaxID=947166 RepID=A0A1D1VAS8_RAMVA|nr:hypothetical protein RvY_07215 [Ramazzottius varieornatus]
MDTDVPVINISVSRPFDPSYQKSKQQLPDRSRPVLRRPADPPRFPSGGGSFGRDQHGQDARSFNRPPIKSRSDLTYSADYPLRPRRDQEVRKFFRDPQERFDARYGNTATSSAHRKEPQPEVSMLKPSYIKNSEVKDASQPSKKKSKLTLSVPSSAKDVSSNWETMKVFIDATKMPRPAWKKPPAPPATSASVVPTAQAEPASEEMPNATADTFVKTKSFSGLTKTVAMDCEFVGVGPGGQENMLARVSVVNQFGHCVYDKFVKPTELVKDYRTHVSGIHPKDLKKGEDFKVVQQEIADILKGRKLVGHAVHNDLEVLLLSHPKHDIRDTSKFKPFRVINKGGAPSLKKLTAKILGFTVQTGEHDSIQDAQAAMRLYTMYKKRWESSLSMKSKKKRLQAKTLRAES